MPRGIRVRDLAVIACAALLAGCTTEEGDRGGRPSPGGSSRAGPTPEVSSPVAEPEGFVLASSFELPVCGVWWRPDQGCEFGVEGEVRSGEFGCRTGDMCLELQRQNLEMHVGVLAPAPAPDGHAFVGAAHRIPEIPAGAIPDSPGYLELEQLSPTDGTLPGWPVEVRFYPDRRLGLGLSQASASAGDQVAKTDWAAPVDEWFYVVVEIVNGDPATQRMWVFGPDDLLVERLSIRLTTRVEWVHQDRTAQKIGGRTSAGTPFLTFADDWYVSSSFQGPLHIGADGLPLAA